MLGVSALAQPARLCLAPGAARRGARQSVGGKPARFAVLAKKAEAEAEPKEKKDKGDKKEKKEKETNGDAAPARKSQKFDPTKRIKVDLSLEELAKVALRAQHDHVYEKSLQILQIELVKLQEYIKAKGLKVVVIFEGRDAAGKGGVISRVAEAMSPRICKVVALGTPTERDKSQWYFQRYVAHLPAAGEMVLFDRSWYNRAGVERVMGFCTPQQYDLFMEEVPRFEKSLTDSGVLLVKYWLDVDDTEQEARFLDRLNRTWKRWKLSPMDLFARSKWTSYARARDEMLKRTDSKWAPWWVLPSDDKKAARLNCISHLLSLIDYEDVDMPLLSLPPRDDDKGYTPPPKSDWRFVPEIYDTSSLVVDFTRHAGVDYKQGWIQH